MKILNTFPVAIKQLEEINSYIINICKNIIKELKNENSFFCQEHDGVIFKKEFLDLKCRIKVGQFDFHQNGLLFNCELRFIYNFEDKGLEIEYYTIENNNLYPDEDFEQTYHSFTFYEDDNDIYELESINSIILFLKIMNHLKMNEKLKKIVDKILC